MKEKVECMCVRLTLSQWVEPGCQAPGGGKVVVGVQCSDSGPLVLQGVLKIQAQVTGLTGCQLLAGGYRPPPLAPRETQLGLVSFQGLYPLECASFFFYDLSKHIAYEGHTQRGAEGTGSLLLCLPFSVEVGGMANAKHSVILKCDAHFKLLKSSAH